MQQLLRLHSIDIYVRDLERSLEFYREKLGFEIVFDARLQSGQRTVGVAPPDGSAVLALIQPETNAPEHKLIGRATRLAFVTEDVAATFRLWSARGVRFRHAPRLRRIRYQQDGAESPIWGEVFTRFEDRDRNSFALVSFDAVNKAIEEQRRALAAKAEEERRSAQELEIARQVQARLFPQRLPDLGTLEYAGICLQARQVGGDYYDFLQLDRNRLAFVLSDIAGKGMAAALLMANLQANLRSQSLLALEEPARFLQSVNKLFFENTAASAYATLFFAEYDERFERLRYVNCGHLPGLVLRADGGVERLESTCTVLGLFQVWECSVAEQVLAAGDLFALYSDGVTEAFDDSDEEFGEARLIEALRRSRALRPEQAAQAVLEDVRAFSPREQHDDMTLIIAKRNGNGRQR
ncbi:MAG TPA: SpoIIE family protein phosphatase [Bryobacteraceae bacterium]|jgi:serine phosphatase RsbU (regulator of sigma subunit)|nr:SpoIIE family protein phosphatase [Bryobacteraceae bacterium]